jgi:hypothetical protein
LHRGGPGCHDVAERCPRPGEAMRTRNWRIVIGLGLGLAMIIVGLIGKKV